MSGFHVNLGRLSGAVVMNAASVEFVRSIPSDAPGSIPLGALDVDLRRMRRFFAGSLVQTLSLAGPHVAMRLGVFFFQSSFSGTACLRVL